MNRDLLGKELNGYEIVLMYAMDEDEVLIAANCPTASIGYRWVTARVSEYSLSWGEWYGSRYSYNFGDAATIFKSRMIAYHSIRRQTI